MEYKDSIYTPIFVKDPKAGYSAYIKEIPKIKSKGRTKVEAEENLRETLEMVLDSSIPTESDWWSDLSESEIESIKQGLKDFEEGKFHGHDEALKIYGKYL